MAELTLADLHQRGVSRLKLIQKVLAGCGTPDEEILVFQNMNPESVLAVATVQAALLQSSPQITVGTQKLCPGQMLVLRRLGSATCAAGRLTHAGCWDSRV